MGVLATSRVKIKSHTSDKYDQLKNNFEYNFWYPLIFSVEKLREACTAKASHNFSTKNIGVLQILLFEILTETLTMSLVLNQAQIFFPSSGNPE